MKLRVIASLAFVASSLSAQRPAAPAVQVSIVRLKESTAQRLVLMLRVEGKGMTLGSYEGRLKFDPAVFTVDSAVAGTDGSRFVNAADAPKGQLRFAGFTPTGFKSTDAVRIVGHSTKSIDLAKLVASLEVAGDLDGKPVTKAGLLGATKVDADK